MSLSISATFIPIGSDDPCDLAEALGMKKPYGALINDVEEGESADNAGLLPGDVIIEFDQQHEADPN